VKVTGPTATFNLELAAEAGLPAEDVDELTVQLRRELLESDVVDVRRAPGSEPPPGARAGDVAAIGSLLVTLSTTAAALKAAVGTLRGWLGSNSNRKVVLSLDGDTIEISGSSDDEQRRLIALWIERHADNGD
jgi:hypothetical protein